MKNHFSAILYYILSRFFIILPFKRNYIYCISFRGQYNGNPKAISQALNKIRPNTRYIWEISSKSKECLPTNVTPVEPNSIKAIWWRSRCKVVIDNYLGWEYGYAESNGIKYWLLRRQKKKRQLNICTWHGVPLKKIGCDMPDNHGKAELFYTTADCLVSKSKYMSSIFEHLTNNKIRILTTGWPRNDLLFNKDERLRSSLKAKLQLPADKRVVLYAPTFRKDGAYMSGIYQIEKLNILYLLKIISDKYGGEWVFVFRAHDSVFQDIPISFFQEKQALNGNVGDDMSEYLLVSDVLITDYSGSLFDYCVTYKPCFLYCPDYDNYSQVERGLYMEMSELPFSISRTEDDLYSAIRSFDESKYMAAVHSFLKKTGDGDDGHASDRVAEIIDSYLRPDCNL